MHYFIRRVQLDQLSFNSSFEFILNSICFFFLSTADQWLDQTINFQPLDIGYLSPIATAAAISTTQIRTVQQSMKIGQTAQLLREFNSVFDAVELTHLTPPQTPPQSPPLADFPNGFEEVILIGATTNIIFSFLSIFSYTTNRKNLSLHHHRNNRKS